MLLVIEIPGYPEYKYGAIGNVLRPPGTVTIKVTSVLVGTMFMDVFVLELPTSAN